MGIEAASDITPTGPTNTQHLPYTTTEDHKNDIMTNSFSVFSSTVAHYIPKAWFVDPVGAILISVIIFVKWMHVGMDHANKIVGRR